MLSWKVLFDTTIWYPIFGLLALILADTLLGVFKSLKEKTFKWDKLADWLSKIGIQVSGIVVLGVICVFQKGVWVVYGPAIATLSVVLIANIVSKIGSFVSSGADVSDIKVGGTDVDPNTEPSPPK